MNSSRSPQVQAEVDAAESDVQQEDDGGGCQQMRPSKANPLMNITGQDSGQGDVDIETEEASPQEQEAVRQYRQKLDQYEAMTESVLSSEAIPLGHRQTIRRYFESIRPEPNEVDQVNEQLEAQPE